MFAEYFHNGGPLMYAVLAAWIVVLAGVLDRCLYVAGRFIRRPRRKIRRLLSDGKLALARQRFVEEKSRSARGLGRINAVSQLATSIGLFGTVVGLATSMFARGQDLSLEVADVLAAGLATALFTTVGGLIVFLFGQGFLIVFNEWRDLCDHGLDELLGEKAP